MEQWLKEQATQGILPDKLFAQAEQYLLANRILLPGPTVLERLVIRITAEVHTDQFQLIYQRLSPELRASIDRLLTVKEGEQRSFFYQLKEYPRPQKYHP